MEKLIEIFNEGSGLNLKQGDSVVIFDSKIGVSGGIIRTNPENINKDACEVAKKAFEKAGMQIRE